MMKQQRKPYNPHAPSILSVIGTWYNSPLGQQVLQAEQGVISEPLSHLFGHHLVQIGGPRNFNLVTASPITHQVHLSLAVDSTFPDTHIWAAPHMLPLTPESIDVFVLPHLFEFIDDSNALLKTIYQALAPNGHLIILGFNPYSLWGATRYITQMTPLRKQCTSPWSGQCLSMYKVRRKLWALNMYTAPPKTCFFRPPIKNIQALNRLLFTEGLGQLCWPLCGSVYLLMAQKLIQPLTPKRNFFWQKEYIPFKKLASTSTRNQNHWTPAEEKHTH